MNTKQRWLTYGIICFMLIWGWDMINELKFKGGIEWKAVFSIFHITQLIYMLSCFVAIRWVFIRFYVGKKYWLLIPGILAVLAGFIVVRYLLEQVLLTALFGVSNYPHNVHIAYYALDNLYYAVVYSILGLLVFLLDNQVLSQKKQADLMQERTSAELAFLRSQVSPHFLFNSLNNIYALSCRQPEKAPDAILTLSDLTRYMLYEKQQKVAVEKEWNYIKSLVSLQQLRYEKPLQLNMASEGDMQKLIEPYLLIPFIENAFKHGVVDDAGRPVSVMLNVSQQMLLYTVENHISFSQKDKDGGIGLENIKRRLELLYPGKYQFEARRNADTFTAVLKIIF